MRSPTHPTRLPLPISLPLVAFVALAGLLFGRSQTAGFSQFCERE